jgi:hypothetical protein
MSNTRLSAQRREGRGELGNPEFTAARVNLNAIGQRGIFGCPFAKVGSLAELRHGGHDG